MADNPSAAIDVPLSLFSGTNTELAPSDIPEGVSPDNQDAIFLPGSAQSRPCLHKLYAGRVNTTPTYAKELDLPNGTKLNLVLFSDGSLWKEDVTNNPGQLTQIGSVTPGAYCQSVSAFSKEWLAFSDGIHGVDAPRQFDGTNLDRVSQDGPGQSPTVADEVSSFTIAAIGVPGLSVASDVNNITTATQSGNLVTLQLQNPSNFVSPATVGDPIVVAGVGVAGYNGTFVISAVGAGGLIIQYVNSVSGLAASAGGTASTSYIKVQTTANFNFILGQKVAIAGAGVAGYNATYQGVRALIGAAILALPVTAANLALANSGGGTLAAAGSISVGKHQCVQFFITRSGYQTKPSPPFTWNATGGLRAIVNNLAIGPSNVVARGLAFCAAGGDNFFNIPADTLVPGSLVIVKALIIPDNVSSQVTVDFDDNTLLGATPIDVQGNNLFALEVLGPCLGFFDYANRLGAFGERNKVQNFLNMGFEGGIFSGAPNVPLGWAAAAGAGALVAGIGDTGMAWQITGVGAGIGQGSISQPAFEDYLNVAILEPLTQYSFRCWAKISVANAVGNLVATITDNAGFTATATIACSALSLVGAFIEIKFTLPLPATLKSTLAFIVQADNLGAGQVLTIDELEVIFTADPFTDEESRLSYAGNPEAFDGVTGILGPQDDDSPIRGCSTKIRKTLYIHTGKKLHESRDNGTTEPSGWGVDETATKCGLVSAFALDNGDEAWSVWVSESDGKYMLRIFDGSQPYKISQEVQTYFDDINAAAQQTIWLKLDTGNKRCYIGQPTGAATAPNRLLPLDYRELDTGQQIASAGPVHISFTGKMIASDLVRKWTRWNVQANCAAILARANGVKQFVLGGGNGLTPGSSNVNAFGNLYSLDPAKLTDDDYGAMLPYYITYFFVNHEMEQSLGVGSHRKLFAFLTIYITGVGLMTITPLLDNLNNPWLPSPAIQLSQQLNGDIEIPFNVTGERCAFKIAIAPLPGQTDVQFNLQKMVVSIRPDPVAPVRGV